MLSIELPRPLFATEIKGAFRQPTQYDVTSDGQRFLINTRLDPDDNQTITLVVNWTARLEASGRNDD